MDSASPLSSTRLDATTFLLNRLNPYLKKKQRILDIGCGKLFFYKLLNKIAFKGSYVGVDIDPTESFEKVKKLKTSVIKQDFVTYNSSAKYDVVVCLWVLEHIKNDQAVLARAHDLLSKDGIFFLVVPSIWSWPVEFGRHGHHYYTKSRITHMVKTAGFTLVELYGSGGFLGLMFTLIMSWPRYLILVPTIFVYSIFKPLGVVKKSWKSYSKMVVFNSWYLYIKYPRAVALQNFIVKHIVRLDNKLKLFPASYVLVLTN